MNCEEFERIGLDAERDTSLSEVERVAAREHAGGCSRCAALLESWQAAGAELRAFAEDTAMAQAPARVEMRLLQEFRTQHVTLKVRRAAMVAAWALAAAAIFAGVVSWRSWRHGQQDVASNHTGSKPAVKISPENNAGAGTNPENAVGFANGMPAQVSAGSDGSEALVADNELSGFTLLPGTIAMDTDDAAILRVRMQRGALGALGLTVNEERASEWIRVDLLVGDDGLPQAVRLPQ